ncbi:MAG: nucleoside recognition domain protein [Myxococcaceae bacterium]|nr:nucleoside recognition domain protein [Myxococcaceae bacterium]
MNWIFLVLIGAAVVTAAFTGKMLAVTDASTASAKSAVELAIGLVGQMTLWLGLMGVVREAGLMRSIANGLKPIMARLFPDVPTEHPAMAAMIMNFAANILGLGNAATPFGLKAMGELDKLNKHRGVATNSMALFLVINTAGLAVLPLGVVAVRGMLGSKDPAGIIVPSLISTAVSTVVAVLICKWMQGLRIFAVERFAGSVVPASEVKEVKGPDEKAMNEALAAAAPVAPAAGARLWVILAVLAAVMFAAFRHFGQVVYHFAWANPGWHLLELMRMMMSHWILPILMLAILLFGMGRRVKVYEAFISAAKEGFQIAVIIIPFLVAILVAVGMFRASGAMEAITSTVGPWTAKIGFPAEALPMALMRPLSGQGSLGVMMETMKTNGVDSFIGYLVSLINGSSETTFYVLALYFGAVQVKAVRHTLAACLVADTVGLVITLGLTHLFFGALA